MKIGDIVVVTGSESIPELFLGKYGEVTEDWGYKVVVEFEQSTETMGSLSHTAYPSDLKVVEPNYILGMDVASKNSEDFSAITMLCLNCRKIIHSEVFTGEYPVLEQLKECPKCGVKFKQEIQMK